MAVRKCPYHRCSRETDFVANEPSNCKRLHFSLGGPLSCLRQSWLKAPKVIITQRTGGRKEGMFSGFFFFFSLYSILAPFCEMKTQIHKATPPTTVKEEGMDWRSIKSGLRLSRREISFYLPATAEFSPNFFLPLLDFVLLSQDWAELQCFYHSPEAIFPHCLIIPHTSDFTQCSCIP